MPYDSLLARTRIPTVSDTTIRTSIELYANRYADDVVGRRLRPISSPSVV